jgi:hypothetical protein
MAFKLTKEERKDFDEARHATTNAWDDFIAAAEEAELARQKYVQAREKTMDVINGVAGRLREELDGKSDTWKESDAGQEAEDFVSTWESFEGGVDDVEPLDIPPGDPLEDELENLPEEVGL